MWKVIVFLSLMTMYLFYSMVVYTRGTRSDIKGLNPSQIEKGRSIFQERNCTACHQIFGLGGYLGPELTTAFSDPARGEEYMKAFLRGGGPRMPDYDFTEKEIAEVMAFLQYVDASASTRKQTGQ